jgi:hypothetical protein
MRENGVDREEGGWRGWSGRREGVVREEGRCGQGEPCTMSYALSNNFKKRRWTTAPPPHPPLK